MGKIKIVLGTAAALILLLSVTYCGSSTKLVSIAVSPTTASAASPTGTAQFTAMGKFRKTRLAR